MKLVSAIPFDEEQRGRLTEIAPAIEIGANRFVRAAKDLAPLIDPDTEIHDPSSKIQKHSWNYRVV